MTPIGLGPGSRACWFVGASYGSVDDQTANFVAQGRWQNGYEDRYIDLIKSIQVGDRIAIKSSYTRKYNIPFDNRGNTVSVMAIKAIGKVAQNLNDGRNLNVDWTPLSPHREWFFYTNRNVIWRVLPGNWKNDNLIAFTFDAKPQDIRRFRNAPYWRERFGDIQESPNRFQWIHFYQAIADKLRTYRNRRKELIDAIHGIAETVDYLSILNDQYQKDVPGGLLQDICPFTTFGLFNRGLTETNRKVIAKALADFLGVSEPVPTSFEGVPKLYNQQTWFFGYSYRRRPEDIDLLWDVFEKSLDFADLQAIDGRSDFVSAFDKASQVFGTGWKLSIGLYWIRPWSFVTLDEQSRNYITKTLNIDIGQNGPKSRCNANDYLDVVEKLEQRFQEEAYPVHSFPDLSLAAWRFKGDKISIVGKSTDTSLSASSDLLDEEIDTPPSMCEPYSIEDIAKDGCFIPTDKLHQMAESLRMKKNLILQGPPGTGKTWLARKLAYAVAGQKDETKVRAVQFHANLSYEDFIRGWRPVGDGKLDLIDGPFMQMIDAAKKSPAERHFIVIEEINRGNTAQILGEMLTLLEADKRTPTEALQLSYPRSLEERVYIPDNLYVIGTMNVADRSLALVDFALRRRFAFVELEPSFGPAWKEWVTSKNGADSEILGIIEERLIDLNKRIAADVNLGRQFRLGHSFVTPPLGEQIGDTRSWFRHIVENEIGPLLHEYWFDSVEEATKAKTRLLVGF